MTVEKIELGRKVKCIVSGVTGVSVGRTEYMNGCARIIVQPPAGKDGKLPDSIWVDEFAVKYVDKSKIDVGPKHQRGGATTTLKAEKPK